MRLWYWLRNDLKEYLSRAEWVHFKTFSAWRTEDLKARRVKVNQGLDLDLRLEMVMIGACLSSREYRVVL